jgi:hypothetical protein
MNIFNTWHTKLNMPKYSLDWHLQDIQDEYGELLEAKGFINRWSELSDIVYTYTRARWSGYKEIKFPCSKFEFFWGSLYMFPKYTLQWKLFRKAAKKINPNSNIAEVRNPKKIHKLDDIAKRNNLDPDKFKAEVQKLLKKTILLK